MTHSEAFTLYSIEFADAVVGIDEFGASGDGAAVYEKYGFDADIIARQIEKNIKK